MMCIGRSFNQDFSARQRQDNVNGNSGVQHGVADPGIKEQGTGRNHQSDPKAGAQIMSRGFKMPIFPGMHVKILHSGHRPKPEVSRQK
ncbi:hypothetical protein D3C75_669030 [compost metagenome]